MPQQYTVIKVSSQEPDIWDGPHGKVYYIKSMLSGHDKPVQVGKKEPDSLKEGDTVYGDITETQYPSDKFRAAQRPQGSESANSDYKKSPEVEESIARAVALKAAVDYVPDDASTDDVLVAADIFLPWLQGKTPLDTTTRDWESLGKDKVHPVIDGEEVSLDSIPF